MRQIFGVRRLFQPLCSISVPPSQAFLFRLCSLPYSFYWILCSKGASGAASQEQSGANRIADPFL